MKIILTVKIIDGSGVFLFTLTIANGFIKNPSLAATKLSLKNAENYLTIK